MIDMTSGDEDYCDEFDDYTLRPLPDYLPCRAVIDGGRSNAD